MSENPTLHATSTKALAAGTVFDPGTSGDLLLFLIMFCPVALSWSFFPSSACPFFFQLLEPSG